MGEDCSSSTTIPATLTVTTASIQPTARLRAVGAISIRLKEEEEQAVLEPKAQPDDLMTP